jgi:predicted kinase
MSIIPDARPLLVALIGPPGAGKTRAAAATADRLRAESPAEPADVTVLSLDGIRARLSPWADECDQGVTPQAVAALHTALHTALHAVLAAGGAVVVDATSAAAEHRRALLDIAARHHARTVALVVLPPLETVLARNAARSAVARPCGWTRRVPPAAVTAMHTAITADLPGLPAEGWHQVLVEQT